MLKQKFCVLKYGLKLWHEDSIVDVTALLEILHNICIGEAGYKSGEYEEFQNLIGDDLEVTAEPCAVKR